MSYNVFISYSTKNLHIVDWARTTLAQPSVTEVFAAEYSISPGQVLNAEIAFDESKPATPLVDDLDGARMIRETGFTPRPLSEAILAHINEARAEACLPPVGARVSKRYAGHCP